jgi:hypothetical protein
MRNAFRSFGITDIARQLATVFVHNHLLFKPGREK